MKKLLLPVLVLSSVTSFSADMATVGSQVILEVSPAGAVPVPIADAAHGLNNNFDSTRVTTMEVLAVGQVRTDSAEANPAVITDRVSAKPEPMGIVRSDSSEAQAAN